MNADVHRRFASDCVALAQLIPFNDQSAVRQLLDENPEFRSYLATNDLWDWNICTDWSWASAPLHHTVTSGHLLLAKILIEEYGLRVNARQIYRGGRQSFVPLHLAILRNSGPMVRLLLDHGASARLGGKYWEGVEYSNALEFAKLCDEEEDEVLTLIRDKLREENATAGLADNVNGGEGMILFTCG